jgi:hypothetical protein
MNKLVKKLVNEAFDTALYPADQQYRIEPNAAFCEKFSQLIIDELAKEFDNRSAPGFGWYELDEPAEIIRNHFKDSI